MGTSRSSLPLRFPIGKRRSWTRCSNVFPSSGKTPASCEAQGCDQGQLGVRREPGQMGKGI